MLQERFKGFKDVLRVSNGNLKDVSDLFLGNYIFF